MMIKGFNKAILSEYGSWQSRSTYNTSLKNRPCVFLSHKHEDKRACRKVAAYLREVGIDYYLDEEDSALQDSVMKNDAYSITEHIKKGINLSTHMLCVISEKTYTSAWVPFEVGYGHAAIIDKAMVKDRRADKIKLSVLLLKGLKEEQLPAYMQVGYIIQGTNSLNDYVSKLLKKPKDQIISEGGLISNNAGDHPLDNVLNWQL